MPEPVVYLNEEFVPASEAKIPIYDHAVLIGANLTDMTRTFGHRPFRLREHVERLYRSCKYANIEPPISLDTMMDKTEQLIETNLKLLTEEQDLDIVHFVTPGENPIYEPSGLEVRTTPTVCIHSFALPLHLWRHLFADGGHVVTPSIRHIPPQCIDPKTKYRSRLHMWFADQQTQAVDPKAISLMLDLDGNLSECVGANFAIVCGNTILSPTSRNRLEGISLITVRELATELGLGWVEKDLQPYDVINADEALITTTPWCVAPCTKINNTPIGEGVPGPVFHKIINAWSDLVGIDVHRQILDSNLKPVTTG